jgi:hypothetical protein
MGENLPNLTAANGAGCVKTHLLLILQPCYNELFSAIIAALNLSSLPQLALNYQLLQLALQLINSYTLRRDEIRVLVAE